MQTKLLLILLIVILMMFFVFVKRSSERTISKTATLHSHGFTIRSVLLISVVILLLIIAVFR